MRAGLVLLGVLISTAALADEITVSKKCRIYLYNDAAIGALCPWGSWHPRDGADMETATWSRENRVLERVLAGETVTIPAEHSRY